MGFIKAALALQLLLSSISTAVPTGLVSLESKAARAATEITTIYDAIVVGGGPAGLSAVSGLARVRRNVLLIDSGEYRNDPTRHMHDVIGTDGVSPAFFRWKARGQLAYYQSATLINGTVTKIVAASTSSAAQDAPFIVRTTLPSGEESTVGARGIILATGLSDIIPSTPGVPQAWGKGIFWCPWCDGNEHADQPLGILSNLNEAASQVQEISTLNNDIIAFVNGTDTPEVRAVTDTKFPGWKEYLELRNIKVENRTIAGLVRLIDGGANEHPEAPTFPEHDLFRVDFTEGPSIERAAFFASFPNKQHSSVGADMGVRLDGGRLAADSTRGLMTNIPGVYAIGDANADNITNVPHAMFSGKRSAVFLHVALARLETAALIATQNNTSVEERGLDLDPRAVWQDMNGGAADILDAGEFEHSSPTFYVVPQAGIEPNSLFSPYSGKGIFNFKGRKPSAHTSTAANNSPSLEHRGLVAIRPARMASKYRRVDKGWPWYELQKGPQAAAKTVLLDYLSPLQTNSFISAIKNKHFAVAATILIFALLKTIIVISTALFILENSSFSQEVQLNQLEKFDASGFWSSVPSSPAHLPGENTFHIAPEPVRAYETLRLQYPDGNIPVHLSTTVTDFSITTKVPGNLVQVSAGVDVLQANATCETATIKSYRAMQGVSIENMTLSTPSCDIGRIDKSQRVNCTGGGNMGLVEVDDTSPKQYQYAIIVGEIHLSNETFIEGASSSEGRAHSRGVDSRHFDSLDIKEGKGIIANFTNLQFSEAIFSSLYWAAKQETIQYLPPKYLGARWGDLGAPGLLKFLVDPVAPGGTFDPLFDPDTLQRVVPQAMIGVGQQIIRYYFLSSDGITQSQASIQYVQGKLHIRPPALWAMVGLFALVACLVFGVLIYTTQSVAPQSPTTLATTASILSLSQSMGKLLHNAGGERLSQMRDRLTHYDFIATRDRAGTPRIKAIVLAIATMFNSLDFAIATMTPFSALAKGRALADRTMMFNIVEDLPPVALSLTASTIGSVLTVVTSGLWFLEPSVIVSRDATGSIQSS
ncbi:hypothetical protein E0Z10_g2290 [Xylaria hypoxylon]|uniref:FAD/NAD(P)-binding domain-containing protein n=1 Tax=Xylaria hypoxylon TaxID=37992 RepID=A0A4Z0Z4K0_9PEZI|nr:hypothetical protein E0Z10_g2290 [Xylaria hypoxylon]